MKMASLHFTGKERDEETSYGYFGARYMDHELMTMWLSVDPLADKYPSISPYAYCAWNPVKLVDPDGNDWYVPEGQSTPVYDKNVTSSNCPEGATYIGKTAHWFGQTENDMQYYYHGDEDGSLSKQDMTVTINGNKDGSSSPYGISDGVSDYYGAASKSWCNTKNSDKSKSLYILKKKGMLGTAKPGQTKKEWDKFAKTTGKRIGRLGVLGSAADITYSVYLDGGSLGENTSGSVGAAAVGWIGAETGAAIGGSIGTCIFPGVGTAIGAGIGAIIGGIGGALGGDALGKKIYQLNR